MINQRDIRRFKRFQEVTFDIPGHVVLAGPNNTGKTTLLQAIASWSLALDRWKQLNDFNRDKDTFAHPLHVRPFRPFRFAASICSGIDAFIPEIVRLK